LVNFVGKKQTEVAETKSFTVKVIGPYMAINIIQKGIKKFIAYLEE